MFERFSQNFRPQSRVSGSAPRLPDDFPAVPGFADFMARYCGTSFNSGIYRVHTAESIGRLTPLVLDCFPSYRNRVTLFGYDWIGRQFALDKGRMEDGEPLIMMFEVDTGDAWEVPDGFVEFHDMEIIDYPSATLASELWDEWVRTNPEALPIAPERCIGFRVPLFLGGDNTAADMAQTDLEVHWSTTGQLFQATRTMRSGTEIGGVDVDCGVD